MVKTRLARAGVVAAATATMLGAAAAPALAADMTLYFPDGRGSMHYTDDGDVFKVCDTRADGHGVTGYVRTVDTDGNIWTIGTIDDGGDSGCDKKGVDISHVPHDMMLCWHGGGCVVSEVFEE